MSFFSTRISIQWPPEEASEPTATMVMSAPSQKFVDLRPLVKPQNEEELKFPFEWAIIGYSEALGDGKMKFHHSLDSRVVNKKLAYFKSGKEYEEEPDQPDIGIFSSLENGDRKEDGEMLNIKTNKIQPYVEIWRTVDGDLSIPEKMERFDKSKDVDETKYKLYEISTPEFEGRYITIGNWGQGILNRRTLDAQLDSPLSCIRTFQDKVVLAYGVDVNKFPHFKNTGGNADLWTVTESN